MLCAVTWGPRGRLSWRITRKSLHPPGAAWCTSQWPWALWAVAPLCVQYGNSRPLWRAGVKALRGSFAITEKLPCHLGKTRPLPRARSVFCIYSVIAPCWLTSIALHLCFQKFAEERLGPAHLCMACWPTPLGTWNKFSYDRN